MKEKLKDMKEHIELIEEHANKLLELYGDISALRCNVKRILASVRILKINFVDISFSEDL